MVEKVESRSAGVPDDIQGLRLPPAPPAPGRSANGSTSPSRMGIEANVDDDADSTGEGAELEAIEKRLLLMRVLLALSGARVADSDCVMKGFELR